MAHLMRCQYQLTIYGVSTVTNQTDFEDVEVPRTSINDATPDEWDRELVEGYNEMRNQSAIKK